MKMSWMISFENRHEFDSKYENYLSNTNEEDSFNTNRGWKGMLLLTDSDDDSEENNAHHDIEYAIDGIVCKTIATNSSSARPPLYTILKGVSHPAEHAKQHIMRWRE